jgi:hypothetical protein
MFQALNKVTGGKPRATRRVILKALLYCLSLGAPIGVGGPQVLPV